MLVAVNNPVSVASPALVIDSRFPVPITAVPDAAVLSTNGSPATELSMPRA